MKYVPVLFLGCLSLLCSTGCGQQRHELRNAHHVMRFTGFDREAVIVAAHTEPSNPTRDELRILARKGLSLGLKLGIALLLSEVDYGKGRSGEMVERLVLGTSAVSTDELLKLIFEEE